MFYFRVFVIQSDRCGQAGLLKPTHPHSGLISSPWITVTAATCQCAESHFPSAAFCCLESPQAVPAALELPAIWLMCSSQTAWEVC